MGTLRQEIIDALSESPRNIRELSQILGLREKELHDHLPHVARSVSARGGRLEVQPARCLACGYEFRNRRRLTPPSRCPKCRQARIEGPWYKVLSAKPA